MRGVTANLSFWKASGLIMIVSQSFSVPFGSALRSGVYLFFTSQLEIIILILQEYFLEKFITACEMP